MPVLVVMASPHPLSPEVAASLARAVVALVSTTTTPRLVRAVLAVVARVASVLSARQVVPTRAAAVVAPETIRQDGLVGLVAQVSSSCPFLTQIPRRFLVA